MQQPNLDLNLLIALDALLEECSVTRAAARLQLSVPAMSRTLGRIRASLGDPVLVRSGRQMEPTPRALALRTRVHAVVEEAQSLFTHGDEPDVGTLNRVFALLAHDEIVHAVGARLLTRLREEAPGVCLRFLAEAPVDTASLRRGEVDLEIGVIGDALPETRVEPLLKDRFVGVVRASHPLAEGRVTPRRFAAARHVAVSRRGRLCGPVDEELAGHGLSRVVAASAPTFAAALLVLLDSDTVGMVPGILCRTAVRALGLVTFDVPFDLPEFEISMAWHPRYEVDATHIWLRSCVRDVILQQAGL